MALYMIWGRIDDRLRANTAAPPVVSLLCIETIITVVKYITELFLFKLYLPCISTFLFFSPDLAS